MSSISSPQSQDIPTPRPRSVKTSSSEQDTDNDDASQQPSQIQTQDHHHELPQQQQQDFFQHSLEEDSKSQSLTMDSEIVTTYDANAPVPKPRSQIKHNESFKNLAAMAEQSDSISLRSLDITDDLSKTEEISAEFSIRSQFRDQNTTTTISTTTTGTGTGTGSVSASVSVSEEQTESYDPTSETSVEDITQRSDVIDSKTGATTSFYIGESSKNIIVKTSTTKSVSDLKQDDEPLDGKDIQMLQELSVDSDESNDVFKEYITMKKDKDDDGEEGEDGKLVRQSSETRNDLLEESLISPKQEGILESLSREMKEASSIEKSEYESSEKEKIPESSKPKVIHSPQELIEKTISELHESLEAAKEDLKTVLKAEVEEPIPSRASPTEFTFLAGQTTTSAHPSDSLVKEDILASGDAEDISSFIGIPGESERKFSQKSPEPSKRSDGLFESNIQETLNKEAITAHYAQDFASKTSSIQTKLEAREEPGSLGFISTGTAEDYSSTEDHAAKEGPASLGFVSTETVEEFSSMEDYYQEKLAKDDDLQSGSIKTSSPDLGKPLDAVVLRVKSETSPEGSNRWSIPEVDNSSSSESYYKTQSRPLSSDVDNLMTQGTSSEYQTALDRSSVYRETTEYISAVSTLEGSSGRTISSQDSMKSFDSHSETSANLGSIDVSELSETLVASSTEADVLEAEELANLRDLRKDDEDYDDNSEDSLEAEMASYQPSTKDPQQQQENPQSQMKRSQEMIFKPKEGGLVEHIVTLDEVEKPLETVKIEEYPKPKEVEKTWGLAYPVEESSHLDDVDKAEDILLYHDEVRRSIDDSKLASSLDEGSILSVSMSSTSNIETVVENFEEMIGSAGSSSLTGIEGFGHMTPSSSMPDEPFLMEMESKDHSPQDSPSSSPPSESKKRGHKRHESTSLSTEALKNLQDNEKDSAGGGPGGGAGGGGLEPKESESESDTDPYESEYTRQFRLPTERKMKKKKQAAAEMDHGFEPEKRPFTPSQLVAEVIVEDSATEELEAEAAMMEERRPSQNMQDYSNIPDIMVTEVSQKSPILEEETDEFQEKILYKVKTQEELHKAPDEPLHQTPGTSQKALDEKEENFRKLVQEQYKQKLAELQRADDSDYDDQKAPDSPDSFEMVEQPDISDEFVIIEEVAKEANEVDLGGKSIKIKPTKYESKHDEEVEKIIIKSAPADPKLGSQIFRDDLNFEFEESPPTAGSSSGDQQEESDSSDLAGNNKRWVEMQLTDNQLRYPYDITGGVLEDIKEEDGEFEVGSSRISSFKDSFSSTPEYARRYYARGEHDDVSLSSLQEFESLEQAISLENRNKTHQGSTDSSNGSFTRRYMVRHSGSGTNQGDDVSVSSLKEFEGLENACMEAHLIEIKAKEEAALLSRSDESNKSNGSSDRENGGAQSSSNVVVTKVTRTITRTEVPQTQQQNIGEILKQKLEECETDEIIVTHSDLPIDSMEIRSTKLESLESEKDSLDSMEISKSHDFMTSSIDSFDISKDATTRSEGDSLEVDRKQPTREESIDSIENEQMDLMSKYVGGGGATFGDGLTTTTTTTTTSTDADGREHTVTRIITTTTSSFPGGSSGAAQQQQITDMPLLEKLPKDISEDSLNMFVEQTTSSAGTTATYQTSAGNSQMSGSVTSCASSTLMEDSFPPPSHSGSMTVSSMSSSFWSHEESTVIGEEQDPKLETFPQQQNQPQPK